MLMTSDISHSASSKAFRSCMGCPVKGARSSGRPVYRTMTLRSCRADECHGQGTRERVRTWERRTASTPQRTLTAPRPASP
jgi:hypothetical protein